ncbi:MAG: hypothetical protein ACI9F9_001554 [Candidatus Paceibacteria bacterium]|jgi:hypothetical protein
MSSTISAPELPAPRSLRGGPLTDPQAWLRGSPEEVLERLADGDPFELARRVQRHLARNRLLMDEHRVYLHCLAFVARASFHYRGTPAVGCWLDQSVQAAINSFDSQLGAGEPGPRWRAMAARFRVPMVELDRACSKFQTLKLEAREAFFALVIEDRSIEQLVYPGGRSAVEIAKDARLGLSIFLGLKSNSLSERSAT